MELHLKRFFWAVPVLAILVCGVLAAKGAKRVIEARSLLGESTKPASVTRKPVKAAVAKAPPTKDAEQIVARNMFCSSCDPPKPADATEVAAAPVDAAHPPNTRLPLVLVATIMTPKNPELAMATIANTQTFKSGSYGVHDRIPDAGEVVVIRPKSVDFRNQTSNRLERIELIQRSAPASPEVAVVAPPPETGLTAAVDKGDKIVADSTMVRGPGDVRQQAGQDGLNEDPDVLTPVSKRWDVEPEASDARVEVRADGPGIDEPRAVVLGGSDDLEIDDADIDLHEERFTRVGETKS